MEHSSPGDPGGRRLAQRKANLLGEANRVGTALKILLERANVPTDDIALLDELLSRVSKTEVTELQKAHGRLDPRSRYHLDSSHPLLDGRPTCTLYLDESGHSEAQPGHAPPLFVLGGVVLLDEDRESYVTAADSIKEEFFGRTNFSFHEPFMRQRRQDSRSHIDYSFSLDEQRQRAFDSAIQHLIMATPFKMFAVAVRKDAYQREFVDGGLDPYLPANAYSLAIIMILERFIDYLAHLGPRRMARVALESQGAREDAQHQLEYARLLLEGLSGCLRVPFVTIFRPGWPSHQRADLPQQNSLTSWLVMYLNGLETRARGPRNGGTSIGRRPMLEATSDGEVLR
jgi:hypothetical protein